MKCPKTWCPVRSEECEDFEEDDERFCCHTEEFPPYKSMYDSSISTNMEESE